MLGERLRSYEQIIGNAETFVPGQRVRTSLILRTTERANRRRVERETLALTEGANALGMKCQSLPDPTLRHPEYSVLVLLEGTRDQFIDLMNYMIKLRTSRAR